jgi:molybdate transport system substrate-binding protein
MNNWLNTRYIYRTFGTLLAVILLVSIPSCTDPKNPGGRTKGTKTLMLYCAAGIKPPVEAAAKQYEKEYGVQIQLQYGGSGTLLTNIQLAKIGDLYLAADDSYLKTAREKGLLAEMVPLAYLRAVIAYRKDNDKTRNIKTIDDLLHKDIKVSLADPDQAAVGRTIRKILKKTKQWDALEKHKIVYKPTVNNVANDIKLRAADAGIVWDATANQYKEFAMTRIPAFEKAAKQITIGVLKSSKHPTEALKFCRYLAARDKGLKHFEHFGYEPVKGDQWKEKPEVTIYSGAMFRPGLEKTIKRFQQREDVTINTIYNGCGILVAQMKAGENPAAYLSCDISFMQDVQERFRESLVLTENDIVILIKKGNTKITSLDDLTKPNVRIGLADEQKSALGSLTVRLLKSSGHYDAIQKNKVVDSPTGDFLVNKIRVGSLDATIVYRSNAMANPENLKKHLDIVEIEHPQALAVQPIAIAKQTEHRYLLERFFDMVRSDQSKKSFESFGFRWRGDQSPQ